MSLSGSLATMQLGDLLQWCGTNLKTGTLHVKRGPIEKQLFFKDGRLFSSISSSPRETLGQFLIRSGHITEEELFKALIEQDRSNRRLGQILVASEVITEDVLEELLRLKTEEAIYDCFLWKDGEFTFEDDTLPEAIPVSLPLDLTGVILEGARRSDEWERIHRGLPLAAGDVRGQPRHGRGRPRRQRRRPPRPRAGSPRQELGGDLARAPLAVEFYAASMLLHLHERKLVAVKESPEEIDFDQQVTELRDKLDTGVSLYNAGDYENALACVRRCSRRRHPKQVRASVHAQDPAHPRGLAESLGDSAGGGAAPQGDAGRAVSNSTSIPRKVSCCRA